MRQLMCHQYIKFFCRQAYANASKRFCLAMFNSWEIETMLLHRSDLTISMISSPMACVASVSPRRNRLNHSSAERIDKLLFHEELQEFLELYFDLIS